MAIRLALAEPRRVNALALIACAGFGREVSWAFRLMCVPAIGHLLAMGYRTAAGARLWSHLVPSLVCAHPDKVPAAWRDELYAMARLPGYLEAIASVAQSAIDWNGQRAGEIVVEGLAKLTRPTLLIWGDRDRVLPLHQGEAAAARLPDGELCILHDCGHVPQVEQPEQVADAILAFLAARGEAKRAFRPMLRPV